MNKNKKDSEFHLKSCHYLTNPGQTKLFDVFWQFIWILSRQFFFVFVRLVLKMILLADWILK